MGVMTVKDLVEHITKYYSDDSKLLIYWWDKETVGDKFDDLCLDADRVVEIWDEAADAANARIEHEIDLMDDQIAEAVSDAITPEEKNHENCIEIVTEAGSVIHRQMEELPPESDEDENEVLRSRLAGDTLDS